MRILMLTTSYPAPPTHPNAGNFVHALAREIVGLGHEVCVLAPHAAGLNTRETIDGVALHRFRYAAPESLERVAYGEGVLYNLKASRAALAMLPSFMACFFHAAARLALETRIDAIFAHWALPGGLAARFAARAGGVPYWTMIHGSDVFALDRPVLRPLLRLALGGARGVFANSEATAARVRRLTGRNDTRRLPMGVDDAFLSPRSRSGRISLPSHRPRLLCCGRLIELKGHRYAIDALARLRAAGIEAELTVVGEGPERGALEALARERGVGEYVALPGAAAHGDMPDIYRAHDLFLMPSIVLRGGATEGMGIVALEAMACGVPVVASNVGGLPTILDHGRYGQLVSPGNADAIAAACRELLADGEGYVEWSRRGVEWVRSCFTWPMIARQALAALETDKDPKTW